MVTTWIIVGCNVIVALVTIFSLIWRVNHGFQKSDERAKKRSHDLEVKLMKQIYESKIEIIDRLSRIEGKMEADRMREVVPM